MKKIISVLLISAGLFGCRFQETETKSQNGYPVSSIFSPRVTFKSVEKNTQKPLVNRAEQESKLQSKTTISLKPPVKKVVKKEELTSKKSQPTVTETKEEKIEVTEGDCGC